MRPSATPKTVEPCLLASLPEKLIKIGAKVVSHGRYVSFQMGPRSRCPVRNLVAHRPVADGGRIRRHGQMGQI
jgi:hypothetical protein